VRTTSLISRMPKSSRALNRIIHITWYVASLAPRRRINHQLQDFTRSGITQHAETAETKSHSASKLLGTPTMVRYWSRHSLSAVVKLPRTSKGSPSESVLGLQSCLDI
jgi:hypothetical protein